MIELTALAFAMTFAVLGLTALVFAATGRERAFVLGLMASQRTHYPTSPGSISRWRSFRSTCRRSCSCRWRGG
jgi:hypothetical protein